MNTPFFKNMYNNVKMAIYYDIIKWGITRWLMILKVHMKRNHFRKEKIDMDVKKTLKFTKN